MPTLQLIITDAGRQAIVDAQNTGTLPVVLDQFALGTGKWTPDATATALQAEIKRIDTVGGLAVADDTIHVTCTDDSVDAYALGEFGLYTDDGVLFAIYSDLAGITDKAADALLLLAADVVLTSVPPGAVTVNGIGFSNPPATENAPGIAEVATQAETDAGTDDERIVTPKKLMAAASSISSANTLVRRDANGNFRTNAPLHDNDVPRKIDITIAINALLDSAPGTLDTLNELAAALGDDPNFATTMANALAALQTAVDEASFDAGTITLFGQSAAPTGWTKLLDQNDKALRVVSGAVGVGGSVAFSTAFTNRSVSSVAAGGTVGNHTLALSQIPSHAHGEYNNGADGGTEGPYMSGTIYNQSPEWSGQYTDAQGGGGAHSHSFTGANHDHTLDMSVQYVDVIRASKD